MSEINVSNTFKMSEMLKNAISAFQEQRGEFEVCRKKKLGLNNEYHEEIAFHVKVKSGD